VDQVEVHSSEGTRGSAGTRGGRSAITLNKGQWAAIYIRLFVIQEKKILFLHWRAQLLTTTAERSKRVRLKEAHSWRQTVCPSRPAEEAGQEKEASSHDKREFGWGWVAGRVVISGGDSVVLVGI
jgi:hypothetical protein